MMSIKKKHLWEPTDNQGYKMECLRCGLEIEFEDQKNWEKTIKSICKKIA